MTYVVIACHFVDKDTLCKTAVARLEKATELFQEGDSILVTGDVPYETGTPTLGQLMKRSLLGKEIPEASIRTLNGGVGTFSEARLVCNGYKDGEQITIISSSWYLFQAQPIWRRRAKEKKLKASFVSVEGTGGLRTWMTYIILGLIIRTATLLGLENTLEKILTESQKGRVHGFKFDGCK